MPMENDDFSGFLRRRDQIVAELDAYPLAEEKRRGEFQKAIRDVLEKDKDGFYLLGDAGYGLTPRPNNKRDEDNDWRRRDINRLLTRHREDRPIEDARWWARLALCVALVALASSFVSAIEDFPGARDNLALAWRRTVGTGPR